MTTTAGRARAARFRCTGAVEGGVGLAGGAAGIAGKRRGERVVRGRWRRAGGQGRQGGRLGMQVPTGAGGSLRGVVRLCVGDAGGGWAGGRARW